jgi:hypothetical protein
MLKLKKKINVKKIKNKDWCQLKLTSYTCDPDHETRMTASKKITKLNLQPSNVEGLKSKKKINFKKKLIRNKFYIIIIIIIIIIKM